jgi:hypothetical protein
MNGFSHDSKVPRPLSPDRTQQMILAHPCLRRQITKHLTLLMIYPSHASTPILTGLRMRNSFSSSLLALSYLFQLQRNAKPASDQGSVPDGVNDSLFDRV